MRCLHDLPSARDVGPMPLRKRWLCAAALLVTSPLWVTAVFLVLFTLFLADFLPTRRKD